jgi:hypothetical protein
MITTDETRWCIRHDYNISHKEAPKSPHKGLLVHFGLLGRFVDYFSA